MSCVGGLFVVDDGQHLAGIDLLTGGDLNAGDDPICRCPHRVLHLHCLQHEHGGAGRDVLAPATSTRSTDPGMGASREPAS